MPHIMFNWSQVKIRLQTFLRRIFQKLDVCVKHHKSENTLFVKLCHRYNTNFFKAHTPCMIVTSKNKIASHSEKNFQKLDVFQQFFKLCHSI